MSFSLALVIRNPLAALKEACRRGDFIAADQILEHHPKYTHHALVESLRKGRMPLVSRFLSRSPRLTKDCLVAAAESRNHRCLDIVLPYGWSRAELNEALAAASKKGHFESVKTLLDVGATDRETAVAYAVRERHYALALSLLTRDTANCEVAEFAAHERGNTALARFFEKLSGAIDADERERLLSVLHEYVVSPREPPNGC